MNHRKDLGPELEAIEERLKETHGKRYWRTLEELADSDAFRELMRLEFPAQADIWPDSISRRRFLSLMGASLALAGLSGCSVRPAPSVGLRPYVRLPEELVPGRPLFFATAMTQGGAGVGLLVESHLGRPTKIEGNPDHPGSLGATDLFNQASILTLYDPDRSQTVTLLGRTSTWEAAFGKSRVNGQTSIGMAMARQRQIRGAGLRILTETIVSPTLGRQLDELLKAFPEAKWHQYEPVNRDMAFRGARQAFGEPVNTIYQFDRADVVLSLDADFLTCGPGNLRYVADFMKRRRVPTTDHKSRDTKMNRLYVVETSVSSTGAKADHRLALRPSEMEGFAQALAARLEIRGTGPAAKSPHGRWLDAVADDLQSSRGRSVVLAGDRQPPAVHALAHAINQRLENVGKTVLYSEPVASHPVDQAKSIRDLVDEMDHGRVEMLVIIGGNPVFTAPADVRFTERMQKVELRVHLSLYQDETSLQCQWHLPEAHYLEAWSDTRAFDGTATITQPLIEPLYQGRSAHEVVSLLTHNLRTLGYELVRAYWSKHRQDQGASGDFDDFWETSIHDGVVAGTRFTEKSVALRSQENLGQHENKSSLERGLELMFQPDPTIYDGRFANNGWLQELPKPITALTWDNAALMSPATAKTLGVSVDGYEHGGEHGGFRTDVIELEVDGRTVRAPVWPMPGHADGAITIYLGYGRQNAGRVGGTPEHPVGFNAYVLRTSEHPWFRPGLKARKTGERYPIACTQAHQLMENRECVRSGTLAEYRERPDFARQREKEEERETTRVARKPLTLYPPFDYGPPKHKWGMVIDLTACTGCKACVVACQAENNIPVVGKDQVLAGREMHWLRIDRYNTGPYEAPEEFYFQPLPCMHCENAPCEYVCPVGATVHSADGLNDMVYNRCVGTRFCSNNCPYKVRRFNFFQYADYATQSLRQQYNPDVTVRSRGVMEKCTYCVQRIRHAEIDAETEGRPVADGEILTACQAACPAEAIVFGDMNDSKSAVKRAKDLPLNYGLLTELNTEPRTTYLASLRNPNPRLVESDEGRVESDARARRTGGE
jgi:molybdopterin-containing oxidoreductase family iron-sulfur binding subunit